MAETEHAHLKDVDLISLTDWENHGSPYYTDMHRRWRQVVKKFCEKEVLPYIDKWEKEGNVPSEFYQKAYDSGVYSFFYPKEFGGTPFEGHESHDLFLFLIFYEQMTRAGSGGVRQTSVSAYLYKTHISTRKTTFFFFFGFCLLTAMLIHGIALPPVMVFGSLVNAYTNNSKTEMKSTKKKTKKK
ncbi:fadE13 [Reticulomyxa filosa]|uniref:FadE13 n=1 Tax=Reticulomyxa filosa TaxID=46433 RepID=X6M763_RETFI|nr:fadE13 [Reticulomyxa filosa]|eukprot:ETO09833.1 fadE13 [Reticulomyxa filosa]